MQLQFSFSSASNSGVEAEGLESGSSSPAVSPKRAMQKSKKESVGVANGIIEKFVKRDFM